MTDPDPSCTFEFKPSDIPDLFKSGKLTVTGSLDVKGGTYNTPLQNQKLTFTDKSIGNFGTGNFSARIVTKINYNPLNGDVNNLIFGKIGTSNLFLNCNSISTFNIAVGSGSISFSLGFNINPTKFYNITLTRLNTLISLYIDGIFIGSSSASSFATSITNEPFIIGGHSTQINRYSKIQCKLVQLYNRALNADEVKALDNGSKFRNTNPVMNLKKWVKSSSSFTELYSTTNDNIIKLGQKYFKLLASGISAIYPRPINTVTYEYSFRFTSTSDRTSFIYHTDKTTINTNNYAGLFKRETSSALAFVTNGVIRFQTRDNYVQINTFYRIRVVTTPSLIYYYIKGGLYGNNYSLITTVGGLGVNPTTNLQPFQLPYTMIYQQLGTGAEYSNIKFYPYIKNN